LERDPALANVRRKIVRMHALFSDSVRIIWTCRPSAQDRAIVDQNWRTIRPKGQVEHMP
jgi:hypothetical protein